MLAISKKPSRAGARTPHNPAARPAPDRYPSGGKKQAVAPALWHRLMEHGRRLGMDPRLGSEIGKLAAHGEISAVEFEAAQEIARIYGRYEALTGVPRRHSASPSYQTGFGARAVDPEDMDEREYRRHQRQIKKATTDFAKVAIAIPDHRLRALVELACCDNERINPVQRPALAEALHKAAVKFGFAQETTTARPSRKYSRDDGKLLADATVLALIQWFEERATKPGFFSLVDNKDWKTVRGITASDAEGRYHHTVAVPLRHLDVKAVDAALRLACAVHGLLEIKNAETGEVE